MSMTRGSERNSRRYVRTSPGFGLSGVPRFKSSRPVRSLGGIPVPRKTRSLPRRLPLTLLPQHVLRAVVDLVQPQLVAAVIPADPPAAVHEHELAGVGDVDRLGTVRR